MRPRSHAVRDRADARATRIDGHGRHRFRIRRRRRDTARRVRVRAPPANHAEISGDGSVQGRVQGSRGARTRRPVRHEHEGRSCRTAITSKVVEFEPDRTHRVVPPRRAPLAVGGRARGRSARASRSPTTSRRRSSRPRLRLVGYPERHRANVETERGQRGRATSRPADATSGCGSAYSVCSAPAISAMRVAQRVGLEHLDIGTERQHVARTRPRSSRTRTRNASRPSGEGSCSRSCAAVTARHPLQRFEAGVRREQRSTSTAGAFDSNSRDARRPSNARDRSRPVARTARRAPSPRRRAKRGTCASRRRGARRGTRCPPSARDRRDRAGACPSSARAGAAVADLDALVLPHRGRDRGEVRFVAAGT